MPDGSTGVTASRIRIPPKLRTVPQLLDAFRVQRDLASQWLTIQQDEARELAAIKKRERRIKEKYAKRKHKLLARRNRIADKTFVFAEEVRPEITKGRSPNTAAFSLGKFFWRTRKVADLPEGEKAPEDKARLEAFYTEIEARGLTHKYVRIKKEPNRAALSDSSNETEVKTFASVALVNRTRFTMELDGIALNIAGTIGDDGAVHEWEYVVPESKSR